MSSETHIGQEIRTIFGLDTGVVDVQFVVHKILYTNEESQKHLQNTFQPKPSITLKNTYRFCCDEHVPRHQRSNAVNNHRPEDQVKSIPRWTYLHFGTFHCHTWTVTDDNRHHDTWNQWILLCKLHKFLKIALNVCVKTRANSAAVLWTAKPVCSDWIDSQDITQERTKLPLKFSSSLGRLLASQAGVSCTGLARNGAFSTSDPSARQTEKKNVFNSQNI